MTNHSTSTEWFEHKNPTADDDPLNKSITTNYTPIENMERHKKTKAANWDWESPKDSVEQLSPRTQKIIEEAAPLHKRFDEKKKKAAAEAEKKQLTVETQLAHTPLNRTGTDSSPATTVDSSSRSRVKNLFRSSKRLFFVLCLCLLIGANVNFELFILSIFLLLVFFAIDVCVYFYTCYTGKEAVQWMWLTDLFNAYVIVALYYLFLGRRN